jgi:hypothetical protein
VACESRTFFIKKIEANGHFIQYQNQNISFLH